MKRVGLIRRSKPPGAKAEREASKRWHDLVVAEGCVMCERWPPQLHISRRPELLRIVAHHVLPKHPLKRQGLENHLWDERNGMGLCEFHHARHHNYYERIPRSVVSDDSVAFATELDLLWLLEAEYPS